LKQGEIWLVNLSPTEGAEITKTRPCVIISGNEIGILPLKVIAPITDYKMHYDSVPWMVNLFPNSVNNLSKRSVADMFQLRSVSQNRLIKKLGCVSEKEFHKILEAIKVVFGIY
jgi:mRNA interferase MazF